MVVKPAADTAAHADASVNSTVTTDTCATSSGCSLATVVIFTTLLIQIAAFTMSCMLHVRSFLPVAHRRKGEIVPMHIRQPQGGTEVQPHSFLTLALDGGKQTVSRPNYFTHGEGTRYILNRRTEIEV